MDLLDYIIEIIERLKGQDRKYNHLEERVKEIENRMPEAGYRIVSEREDDD